MKLIVPIDWGGFQVTLIYRFCAHSLCAIHIPLFVNGPHSVELPTCHFFAWRATGPGIGRSAGNKNNPVALSAEEMKDLVSMRL
jgi:hypothetical protein